MDHTGGRSHARPTATLTDEEHIMVLSLRSCQVALTEMSSTILISIFCKWRRYLAQNQIFQLNEAVKQI